MDNTFEMSSIKNSIPTRVLEATSVLAQNLLKSESLIQYQEAERKLQADKTAMQLLTDISGLQQQIRSQQHNGSLSESDINRLRELQLSISTNDAIMKYNLAKQMAESLLKEVNQEISQLMGIDFASLTRRSGGCC